MAYSHLIFLPVVAVSIMTIAISLGKSMCSIIYLVKTFAVRAPSEFFKSVPLGIDRSVFLKLQSEYKLNATKTSLQRVYAFCVAWQVVVLLRFLLWSALGVETVHTTIILAWHGLILYLPLLVCTMAPLLVTARNITAVHALVYILSLSCYFVDEMYWSIFKGSFWYLLYASIIVRIIPAIFFETVNVSTVALFELVHGIIYSMARSWYTGTWLAGSDIFMDRLGPAIFIVGFAFARQISRTMAFKRLLVAKNSSQVNVGMRSMLVKVCDAVVELDADAAVAAPSEDLATLLLSNWTQAEQTYRKPFVDLLHQEHREQFREHLFSATKELVSKQEAELPSESLPVTEVKTAFVDAGGASVSVKVFHACFLGVDNAPRHLLGIVEDIEDRRQLHTPDMQGQQMSMSHLVERSAWQDGSVSDNDISVSSEPSETISGIGLEDVQLSCWIAHTSRDWTICKTTIPFDLLWGNHTPTSLRSLIYKKHKSALEDAIRILTSPQERFRAISKVAIPNLDFEPHWLKRKGLGFSSKVFIHRPSHMQGNSETLVRIDIEQPIWERKDKRRKDCGDWVEAIDVI